MAFTGSQNSECQIEINSLMTLPTLSLPIPSPHNPEHNTDFWLSNKLTLSTVGNVPQPWIVPSRGSVRNPKPNHQIAALRRVARATFKGEWCVWQAQIWNKVPHVHTLAEGNSISVCVCVCECRENREKRERLATASKHMAHVQICSLWESMWLRLLSPPSTCDCFVTKDDSQSDICGHMRMWALPQNLYMNHETSTHTVNIVQSWIQGSPTGVRKWEYDRVTVQISGLRGRQPIPWWGLMYGPALTLQLSLF